jgi:hypothetical protein
MAVKYIVMLWQRVNVIEAESRENQGVSACLACRRPWVPFPVRQGKKKGWQEGGEEDGECIYCFHCSFCASFV